jgi:hypothetical protein
VTRAIPAAERLPRGAPNECWPWTKARRGRRGEYGQIKVDGRARFAHQVAWELANGRHVPRGKMVLHECDNGVCCNPAHLKLGTHIQNMRDMRERGRAATGDRNVARRQPELVNRGSRNGMAKLTEIDVRSVVRDLGRGESQASIARAYGVSRHTVHLIANGKTWQHVGRTA